jgi:serine protease Do
MTLRNLVLTALTLLLSVAAAMGQQPSASPGATIPQTPDATNYFSFSFGGDSFLGIFPEEINKENMSRYGLSEVRGVAIARVVEGSPAERAGLKKDDVILRFNNEEVTSVRKLNRMLSEVAPDHAVRLTISRGGAEQEVSVTLGRRNEGARALAQIYGSKVDAEVKRKLESLGSNPGLYTMAFGNNRRIGVSTTQLTKQLGEYFGVADGRGALISGVTENSPAAKAGLRAGDVITEVDGEKIGNAADLMRAVNRKSEGEITLTIIRNKDRRTIKLTPERGQATPFYVAPEVQVIPQVGEIVVPQSYIRLAPSTKPILLPRIKTLPRITSVLTLEPME